METHRALVLSAQQHAYFDAFGFLQLPGLLADEIVEIAEAFDAVFADVRNPRMEMKFVGYRFRTRYAMPNFIERHPRLTELASDPSTFGVVGQLLGSGCEYVESDGSIYSNETEWHYDTPSQPERRHAKVSLYLDPLDRDTGAPRVMPATHLHESVRTSALAPALGYDGAIESRVGVPGEDLPGWTLATRPGDVLIWDFRLLHASYGSRAPRRQIALNFRAV